MLDNSKKGIRLRLDILWILSLILFFSVEMNYDWRTSRLFWYGSLAFVVITYLIAFRARILLNNMTF